MRMETLFVYLAIDIPIPNICLRHILKHTVYDILIYV